MASYGSRSLGQLDIEQPDALLEYLKARRAISPDEQPEIRVLAGGVSNRTVWVGQPSGENWVLKQALEKLRVQTDWFSSPERVYREAMGLRWLQQLAPPETVPQLVFEDHDYGLLAMQAVPEPHDNLKALLLKGQLDLDHIQQFGHWLAIVHRHAYEQKQQVATAFADRSFFETLRIAPYYAYTADQVPEAASFLNDLITTTRDIRLTLVHGDYSPKNVLVYQDRLIVLDFEVIHFGDPAFDLGFSMTHLLSKAHHLATLRTAYADATRLYWKWYRETLGALDWAAALEARAVRHTLGCLLARVAGKSPLEYLNPEARLKQKQVVLALMAEPPQMVPELIDRFIAGL